MSDRPSSGQLPNEAAAHIVATKRNVATEQRPSIIKCYQLREWSVDKSRSSVATHLEDDVGVEYMSTLSLREGWGFRETSPRGRRSPQSRSKRFLILRCV